jgi:hypothetical protein
MKRRIVKRSPAQIRQQRLYTNKGQLAMAEVILRRLSLDDVLTLRLRNLCHDASYEVSSILDFYNKEVGW